MLGRGVVHCHHGSSYKALLRLHFICGCLSYDDHDGDVMCYSSQAFQDILLVRRAAKHGAQG